MMGKKTGLWVEFENLVSEKTRVKTRVEIFDLIGNNPEITNRELADKIGISIKGIEWQVAKLKQLGKIERVGSKKGGHWIIVGEKDE